MNNLPATDAHVPPATKCRRIRVLIHTIAFSPDGVSTAYLYNDIARYLQAHGFDVEVITTTPHYNLVPQDLQAQPLRKRLFGLYYVSNLNGIPVRHIWQKKFPSAVKRMAGFVYWHFVSLLMGLLGKSYDVILSPSPPLTIGLINILVGKIRGSKVIYNVQEIYPDFLIDQKGLKAGPVLSLLRWMERFVYNHSAAVTTIDRIFYDTISPRFRDAGKLHIIPNFVDTSLYRPLDASQQTLGPAFPPLKTPKVMYAGNIGYAQDWETLLIAAEKLSDVPVTFFVIGEGVTKNYLEKEVAKRGLRNIELRPYQQRQHMPLLLAYADLQFIFMSPEMEGHGFPSKVYTVMACARPLLVCTGADTPLYNFLRDKDCAHLIHHADPASRGAAVADFIRNTSAARLAEMGQNGFQVIQESYTSEKVCGEYGKLVADLTK